MNESTQERRRKRLKQIVDVWYIEWQQFDEDVEENIRPYMNGVTPIPAWCLITKTEQGTYALLFDKMLDATTRGDRDITDDICPEWPQMLYRLDSEDRWIPSRVEWASTV